MLEQLIVTKLQAQKVDYEIVPNSEWVKVVCMNPDHHDSHPSAGINTQSGIHHCFSCGHNFMFLKQDEAEDADALWQARYANLKHSRQQELGSVQEAFDIVNERNYDLHLPPVDHAITDGWRGLSAELCEQLGIYYCSRGKYLGRYVLPAYDPQGRLESFDARIVDATARLPGAKYLRPKGAPVKRMIYPQQVFQQRKLSTEHLIITEGPMDALSYIQMGQAAICSFGLTPPDQERINRMLQMGVQKVTLAFDNDEPGIQGMLKVLPIYEEWFDIVQHPMVNLVNQSGANDANEFLENTLKLKADLENGISIEPSAPDYGDGGDIA